MTTVRGRDKKDQHDRDLKSSGREVHNEHRSMNGNKPTSYFAQRRMCRYSIKMVNDHIWNRTDIFAGGDSGRAEAGPRKRGGSNC